MLIVLPPRSKFILAMRLYVTTENGYLNFLNYEIQWGNALNDQDLQGFFSISCHEYSLEFGMVDQPKAGIYLTKHNNGECVPIKTFWLAH